MSRISTRQKMPAGAKGRSASGGGESASSGSRLPANSSNSASGSGGTVHNTLEILGQLPVLEYPEVLDDISKTVIPWLKKQQHLQIRPQDCLPFMNEVLAGMKVISSRHQ